MIPTATTKSDVLNREFLEVRAKILELAAALDRLDRAAGDLGDDPRTATIARGLAALDVNTAGRAATVQAIFSLPYDPQWRVIMKLAADR